jgi:hypothetical protein
MIKKNNNMELKDFLEKREKWLNEVSDQCHEYALKIDLDFYVFQTPSDKYKPKLLIIGINPGGSKPYSQALKEKGYDKRPANDLGPDVNLLVEKPEWSNNDKLRNSLQRVFHKDNGLDILEDTVMMNMFYFNTAKSKDIDGINSEIRKYCIAKTIEFIDILEPQNILFLTTDDKKLKPCGVKSLKEAAKFVRQGTLGKYTVYAIPHYASPHAKRFNVYSDENSAKLGKDLSLIFK